MLPTLEKGMNFMVYVNELVKREEEIQQGAGPHVLGGGVGAGPRGPWGGL